MRNCSGRIKKLVLTAVQLHRPDLPCEYDARCTDLCCKQANALKKIILDEAAGTSNGLKTTPQQRDAISKAVNALVALNPTKDVTTSELATGKPLCA